MKKILYFLLLSVFWASCDSEELLTLNDICTLEDRWIGESQNQSANTLYEFYDGLRYTIYSDTTNSFGTRDQAIPNPNTYFFEGDSIVIDLNFGNFITALPNFNCDCNVLELSTTQGISRFYKEGYDISLCD